MSLRKIPQKRLKIKKISNIESIASSAYSKMKNKRKDDIKKALNSIASNVRNQIQYKNPEASMSIHSFDSSISLTPSQEVSPIPKNKMNELLYESYKNFNKMSKDTLLKIATKYYNLGIIDYIPSTKTLIILLLLAVFAALIYNPQLFKALKHDKPLNIKYTKHHFKRRNVRMSKLDLLKELAHMGGIY